jgi:hypothetical protein
MALRPLSSNDEDSPNKVVNLDLDGTAFDWVFVAMSKFRLGDKADAEKWLAYVADHLQSVEHDPFFDDPNWDWESILELKMLYDEARILIKGQAS